VKRAGRGGGRHHDPTRHFAFAFARSIARSSCVLFIVERPSIFSRVA